MISWLKNAHCIIHMKGHLFFLQYSPKYHMGKCEAALKAAKLAVMLKWFPWIWYCNTCLLILLSFFFLFLPLFISLLLLLIFLLFLLFFSGGQKNQHYELNTITLQSLFYVPILWHTLQYIRVSFPLWYFSVCFICDKVFIGIISFYNSSVKF